MKTLNKIFLSVGVAAASAMGFSSCTDDLNLDPTNPSDITDVNGKIDQVFADIYMNFATYGANGNSPVHDYDGGMATFQRAIFTAEELPTDEACWLYDAEKYGTLNYGLVNSTNPSLFGFYSRMMINISLCNDFIRNANSGAYGDVDAEKKADYIRQARTLRAACYFYMCSAYDKVPYSDETSAIGDMPVQLPRAKVFENVTADLEEVVAGYAPNQKPVYGFVGLDVAESLLVKFYLNAEVFTGQAQWTKCCQHAQNVIDRLGHSGPLGNGLAQSYTALFGANNKKYALGAGGNVNEIIWTIPQNVPHLTSYAGATFLICAWLGNAGIEVTIVKPERNDKNPDGTPKYATDQEYQEALEKYNKMLDPNDDDHWKTVADITIAGTGFSFDPKVTTGKCSKLMFNADDNWGCMVARETFVDKFAWEDAAKSVSNDKRVENWLTSKFGFTTENISLVGDDWGKNGYLAIKFTNWAYNDDGTINVAESPKQSGALVGGDYPVIRLAEIYLSYAEAALNGGGDMGKALTYVNYIRERAGVAPFTSLTSADLRDERCRELYQENCRRTDLIRYNQWCTGYNWPWKGGVKDGTNLPEYTKLYPIPDRVLTASNFEQTTGY